MRVFFNSWRDTAHPLAGGSELAVDRLATELVGLGHEVTVAVPRPVEAHPYRVVTTGSYLGQYVRGPLTVRRDAKDADVIIDVENGINHFTPLWRRQVPVVCWVHHVADEQWSEFFNPVVAGVGRRIETKLLPKVYRRAAYVTASESTADALVACGVRRESISIISYGIDLPVANAAVPKSEAPLYVTVARLVPHKRIDLLLEMWQEVSGRIDGELVVIGDGPMMSDLRAAAPKRCRLLGRVSDEERDAWLHRAWLFLQTSNREGWGLTVTEAAAHGTPTLAFDAPGSRDAVVDGQTGVLAHDRADFERRWVELADDAVQRDRMGAAALERARSFSWSRCAKEFEALMAKMLAADR